MLLFINQRKAFEFLKSFSSFIELFVLNTGEYAARMNDYFSVDTFSIELVNLFDK